MCRQPTSGDTAQQLRCVEAASAVAAAHMLLEGSNVWSFQQAVHSSVPAEDTGNHGCNQMCTP